MSGGSHNYVCYKIADELCGQMHDAELNDLMKDIVQLAHDVEWYDSADYSEDTYKESINKFKAKWFKSDRNERLKKYIDEGLTNLRDELYKLID